MAWTEKLHNPLLRHLVHLFKEDHASVEHIAVAFNKKETEQEQEPGKYCSKPPIPPRSSLS